MRLYIRDESSDITVDDGNKTKKIPIFSLFPNPNNAYPYYGLLPPVVKFMSAFNNKDNAYVIIEGMPMQREIRVSSDNKYTLIRKREAGKIDNVTTYMVNIPWHHWMFKFRRYNAGVEFVSVHLAFSKTQITDIDHQFYMPYLLNVSNPINYDFKMPILCIDTAPLYELAFSDNYLANLYEDLTKIFWGGFFNLNLCAGLNAYKLGGMQLDYSFPDYRETLATKMQTLSAMNMDEVHDMLGQYTSTMYPPTCGNLRDIVQACQSDSKILDVRKVFTDLYNGNNY